MAERFRQRNQTEMKEMLVLVLKRRCAAPASSLQYSDFNWSFTRLQLGLGLCEEVVSCKDPLERADISVCKHPRGSISIYIILSFTEGLLVTQQKSLAPPPKEAPEVWGGLCWWCSAGYMQVYWVHPVIKSASLSYPQLGTTIPWWIGLFKKEGVN